ncbi:ankyrin repeat and SOCS box protein 11 [Sorghum bicolor]|uniref:ankyrin repeat and SOCS box protein 11 n=1 Tax=Sorghum bicolor TaxID=4558 RepID=UPI000B424C28|nr:ankyrin repeat and SOCS box protein 11 [Sorghum bicolor]|eukprot:XP_021302353.1 ankyrin repeat and SOCS box protein 11 [Sorghum bicolor]
MAPPLVGCKLHRHRLLQAAAHGDLRRFKRIASALDGGKGRIREAVEVVVDGNGAGALHVAAAHGRTRVCAYLVEELQMDVNDTAVLSGICVMVELLLSKGADVNSLSCGGTPLHVAAMENHGAVMKILLDYNADCNKEFFILFTPLFTALRARSLNCVKHLIKAGADVMKGIHKFTPLILAAYEGLTDFYECLLEAGADPNVPDDSGLLPIEIAAFQNRRKDVEILFRVTSRIPSVHDWSVDGVLTFFKYVKSFLTDQDDPMYKMDLADLKLEGSKAYNEKDYSTAVKLYSVAIMKADSGDATLLSNRSLCFIRMGEGDKALVDAEACRALQPYWPKACFRQGAAHMLLKDYEKACDAFLDGLKLDPANDEMENALREALNSFKISRAT